MPMSLYFCDNTSDFSSILLGNSNASAIKLSGISNSNYMLKIPISKEKVRLMTSFFVDKGCTYYMQSRYSAIVYLSSGASTTSDVMANGSVTVNIVEAFIY